MKEKKPIKIMPDLPVICENTQLPFPLAEYQNRLRKIRLAMEEKGIELLYLTMPESLYYVSGMNMTWYKANSSPDWYDTINTGIAIHVDHDHFILFEGTDEAGCMYGSTCATDIRIKEDLPGSAMLGRTYDAPAEGQDFLDLIIADLKQEGWLTKNVALEMGSYRPNRLVSEKFEQKLKAQDCNVMDGTDIVRLIRRYKSPLEMNYVVKAAAIADIGHKAVLDHLRAGRTELEMVGIYTHAMMAAGGESMGIVDMVRSGKGKLWWGHGPASRKIILQGEPVGVDLSGVYNRYHANVCRYYHVGEPDAKYEKLYHDGNVEVMKHVREILKPNMLINDFYADLKRFYKETGIWEEQCWLGGYELGISFPPDWCGSFVHDVYKDAGDERFEPGMVMNFETGFGVVDTVIFTEEKAEILGNTSWELGVVE